MLKHLRMLDGGANIEYDARLDGGRNSLLTLRILDGLRELKIGTAGSRRSWPVIIAGDGALWL